MLYPFDSIAPLPGDPFSEIPLLTVDDLAGYANCLFERGGSEARPERLEWSSMSTVLKPNPVACPVDDPDRTVEAAALRDEVTLQRDEAGALFVVDGAGMRLGPVEPVRGFPLTDPDRWISLCDATGRQRMIIEDLAALDPQSRQTLVEALARREFVPVVRRILSLPVDSEPTEWRVATDRGMTTFQLNSADDVRRLGPHRVLVVDARGIRYLIDDVRKLDPLSQRVLERYL